MDIVRLLLLLLLHFLAFSLSLHLSIVGWVYFFSPFLLTISPSTIYCAPVYSAFKTPVSNYRLILNDFLCSIIAASCRHTAHHSPPLYSHHEIEKQVEARQRNIPPLPDTRYIFFLREIWLNAITKLAFIISYIILLERKVGEYSLWLVHSWLATSHVSRNWFFSLNVEGIR